MELMKTGAAMVMSSREIAELTGKRHDHVVVDISKMLFELYGDEGVPRFLDTYTHPQNGQSCPEFLLPKRETLTLVSGYSITLRTRIIDRWKELENAAPKALPQDYRSALVALVAEVDAKEAAERARDHAIATDAAAVGKVNRLGEELGRGNK